MTELTAAKYNTATQCLCEFSRNPFEECYCYKVTGKSAQNIATYCMDNYLGCPIYQKRKEQSPK
jgi:hypothetical protein